MGGFFGAVSTRDVSLDIFFGVDYHSHLGTRRGGMILHDAKDGFQRQIHSIENTPFRTKFEKDLTKFHGCSGIGCISDTDPQPLLVRSHLGLYAITTVGIINNAEELVDQYFSDHGHQFMAMSSGKVNSTELAAALINQKDNLVDGILHAQEAVAGSLTLLILTANGEIVAARDRMGRLPVLIGKGEEGHCVSFESFAYHKLGYEDAYELGPREIVRITAQGFETISPPGQEMKICAFLWSYYGYPNSNYEGVNVEVMRYRNGAIMARDEEKRGSLPDVDYVAGVPDSGIPHAIGYANASQAHFARPFVKYTPTWPRSFGRLHRPGHPAAGDGGISLRVGSSGGPYALRLSPYHVQLQISELFPGKLRHGPPRPPHHSGPGGGCGPEACGRVRRCLHPTGPVHAEGHLRKIWLRLPGLSVPGRPPGGHRHRQGQGVYLLLVGEGIISCRDAS